MAADPNTVHIKLDNDTPKMYNAHGQELSALDIIKTATITLTDAQVKTLPSTPVEILPAPGANKLLVFMRAVVRSVKVAGYTNITTWDGESGGTLSLTTPESDNLIVSGLIRTTTLLSGTATKEKLLSPQIPLSNGRSWSLAEDDPEVDGGIFLQAYNAAGDFTGGNAANTFKMIVFYGVVSVA